MNTTCPHCGEKIGGVKTLRQFSAQGVYPSHETVCLTCEHPIALNRHPYEFMACVPFGLAFLGCLLMAHNGAVLRAAAAGVVVIAIAVVVYAWMSFGPLGDWPRYRKAGPQ